MASYFTSSFTLMTFFKNMLLTCQPGKGLPQVNRSISKRKLLYHQNPSIPEHQEWIKRGQRILGGLLRLSTRTRPDLAYSVSSTIQVLTHDLELLKTKLRHLFQYLNSTKTMGLLYRFPRKREMIEFTIFGDSSFAPSGKHSQSSFTIHLTYHDVRHLVHWQSLREPESAESSAESAGLPQFTQSAHESLNKLGRTCSKVVLRKVYSWLQRRQVQLS